MASGLDDTREEENMSDPDVWNSNDIDSIDKKITEVANDNLDGIESSLNHIDKLNAKDFSDLHEEMKEMLGDLIMMAINDASSQVSTISKEKMKNVTGGLNLPF